MATHTFTIPKDSLTKSQLVILEYIYSNIEMIPFLTITEISNELGISDATITRFSKKVGYPSFKEMKMAILSDLQVSPAKKLQNSFEEGDLNAKDNLLIFKEIQHLIETVSHLDMQTLNQAIHLLLKAKKIYVFAKGAAKSPADLLVFRLNRFDLDIQLVTASGSELFEKLNNLSQEDAIVLFRFGSVPREIKLVEDYGKKIKVPILSFADRHYNSTSEEGITTFFVARGLPDDYHSMTSVVALIDTLIVEMAKQMPEEIKQHLENLFSLKESYKHNVPR